MTTTSPPTTSPGLDAGSGCSLDTTSLAKMHFANMEERRVKSWVSLLCRAATEDGSIWDLLPMYTSLNQPPQDVMTHHAELDGSIACDGPILAHCLDRLSGCTRHTPCTKAVQHDPSGQQPGRIHHHQLRQPAKVSTQNDCKINKHARPSSTLS